jgi:hypothetical protein
VRKKTTHVIERIHVRGCGDHTPNETIFREDGRLHAQPFRNAPLCVGLVGLVIWIKPGFLVSGAVNLPSAL